MKLLIVTQKIDQNDDVLGFMHGWIAEFAKNCDEVTAVCLSAGEYHFPENVRVFSLGKETGRSRLKYLRNFYRLIFREVKNYDTVLVHMNPEYIVLAGWFWKLLGKKVSLWYAHGHTPWSLRAALPFVDIAFTSTASGFRLPTDKLRIIGQGIDTDRLPFIERSTHGRARRITLLGRIARVKRIDVLLEAFAKLPEETNIELEVAGGPQLPDDDVYLSFLRQRAKELGVSNKVIFSGAIPFTESRKVFERADIFASPSRTGSFDKAAGEAMASGLPIVISNIAFNDVLGGYAPELMFPGDADTLAQRISRLLAMSDDERNELGRKLRNIIVEKHSLKRFVKTIVSTLQ